MWRRGRRPSSLHCFSVTTTKRGKKRPFDDTLSLSPSQPSLKRQRMATTAIGTSSTMPKKPKNPSARLKSVSLSCEEELAKVNTEIGLLEEEISANAQKFSNARNNMMTGLISAADMENKKTFDKLIDELKRLKETRASALSKIEALLFSQEKASTPPPPSSSAAVSPVANDPNTGGCRGNNSISESTLISSTRKELELIGFCKGGCKELLYDKTGCADICQNCGAVYEHRTDCSPEHFAYEDVHMGEGGLRRRGGGYKPPNHFTEIIAQFQGKRRSSAPKDVVAIVGGYCNRYGLEKHKITPKVCRMFLKQKQQEESQIKKYSAKKRATPCLPLLPSSSSSLSCCSAVTTTTSTSITQNQQQQPPQRKYTDYYRYCPEIAWLLSGIPPPYMCPMQEDRVVALFPMTVEAYKTSPRYLKRKSDRTNRVKESPNLLNYYYVFYKLCQLLNYNEFLPYIPLPKSQANIEDCDNNGWKHVCEYYGWAFIPTTKLD